MSAAEAEDFLVACRDAVPGEVPASAARLARYGSEAGWAVRVTYARGYLGDKPITSVVVRLRLDPLAAVGAWHNGKYAVGYVGSRMTYPQPIGARALAKFVKEVFA